MQRLSFLFFWEFRLPPSAIRELPLVPENSLVAGFHSDCLGTQIQRQKAYLHGGEPARKVVMHGCIVNILGSTKMHIRCTNISTYAPTVVFQKARCFF